jgi:hypothetical protein
MWEVLSAKSSVVDVRRLRHLLLVLTPAFSGRCWKKAFSWYYAAPTMHQLIIKPANGRR